MTSARLARFAKPLHKSVTAIGVVTLLLVLGVIWENGLLFPKTFPEVEELAGVEWEAKDYERYFTDLAKEKGALYAFDVLRRAPIPSYVDVHPLAHGIGYVLYDEKGIEGMRDCTQEFGNACAHSVVIDSFVDNGPGALSKITQTCTGASDSGAAYSNCFHGLGHGVLAYFDYEFKPAIEECRRAYDIVVRDNPDRNLHPEEVWHACVGGVTMELTQGDHDPDVWAKASEKYFSASDPLMPCDAAYVPDEVRPICYSYLSGRFLEAAGGVRGHPDASLFPEAFSYCRQIPESDTASQEGCYGGFGTDLVYFASGDARAIPHLPDEKLSLIHEWCADAQDRKGEDACVLSALYTVFLDGQGVVETGVSFCRVAREDLRDACYKTYISYGRYFFTKPRDLERLCAALPETYQASCREQVGRS